MPLRTKLYTHIFADNEHWSWQKFAVKRDKSVQFMKKKKSEATSGPRAFVSGHFYSMTFHAPSACNDTASRHFTLCQKCKRFYFILQLLVVAHNMLWLWLFLNSVLPRQRGRGPDAMTCCLIIQPEWRSRINRYTVHNVNICPLCHSYLFRRGGYWSATLHSFSVLCKWVIYFLLGIGWVRVCQGFAVIISSFYSWAQHGALVNYTSPS